jgi:sulfatase modifying factor 1
MAMKNIICLLGFSLLIICCTASFPLPEMILVEGGTFVMGEEGGKYNPEHKVELDSFYISPYPVTVLEWKDFTSEVTVQFDWNKNYYYGDPSSPFPWQDADPIVFITWDEAVMYCNWLSKKHGLKEFYNIERLSGYENVDGKKVFNTAIVSINSGANGFRLPSEAEWEYAARGGQKSQNFLYPGSNDINEVCWYQENTLDSYWVNPVGKKKPNELGLYDMSGNASTWCWDYFDVNYFFNSPLKNPIGPDQPNATAYLSTELAKHARSFRGGNIFDDESYCLITVRKLSPEWNRSWIGLRIVRNAK